MTQIENIFVISENPGRNIREIFVVKKGRSDMLLQSVDTPVAIVGLLEFAIWQRLPNVSRKEYLMEKSLEDLNTLFQDLQAEPVKSNERDVNGV